MSTATSEQVEVTLTAAEIDRLAQRYRMGHASTETIGDFMVRMTGGSR